MHKTRMLLILLAALAVAAAPAAHAFSILGTGTGALLGGDLTDPENDINDNTGDLLGGRASSGENFNWVQSITNDRNYFGDPDADAYQNGIRQGALDAFDNKVGGSSSSKWCCGGPPQYVGVQLVPSNAVAGYVLTHFTIASGGDADYRRPDVWEIQGSDDGVEWETIYRYDNDGTPPFTAHNQVVLFESALGPNALAPGAADFEVPDAYRWFRYEVTSTLSNQHQIEELEFFGELIPEPATLSLLGLGALALARRRRRR